MEGAPLRAIEVFSTAIMRSCPVHIVQETFDRRGVHTPVVTGNSETPTPWAAQLTTAQLEPVKKPDPTVIMMNILYRHALLFLIQNHWAIFAFRSYFLCANWF